MQLINEKKRTFDAYNFGCFDADRADGLYQFPRLEPCTVIPAKMMDFNAAFSAKPDAETAVHFYIDDYRFERVWNQPVRYIERLKKYAAVLTPDFSLYTDMPLAMKIWNIYRSRLIGQMMQDAGLAVIPTLSWAEKATFDFCFDGLPKNSVVSVGTLGVKGNENALTIWRAGMDEAMKRLNPSCVLVYGGAVDYNFSCPVRHYENLIVKHLKTLQKKEEKDGA